MESTDHIFNSTENQLIVCQIFQNDKPDRRSFGHYSQRFDTEFLIGSEENVNPRHTNSLQALENEITKRDEKIKIIISYFSPLLDLTEAFLHLNNHNIRKLQVTSFSLNELRKALNKKCLWEIQRSCLKIISDFEQQMDEFIDKGCLSIILANFNLLIRKLRDIELEFADATRQQDMNT